MPRSNRPRRLRSCLWELTLRCNMHCMHCGSAAGRARRDELTLDECFPVVDQLAELGCEELGFIGGEIFLYRGWERVARYASDGGMLVNIMTNAYGMGDNEIERIQHARLSNVGVSVDGMEEHHNRIRGRRNAFAEVSTAFDLLARAGITSAAVTSLLALNVSDLEPLYEFLLAKGVHIWQLQLVNPMGNLVGRHDLTVDPAELPGLIDFIYEKTSERRMIVVAADSIGYYHGESEGRIRGRREPVCCWEGCQAGLTSVFIDSVGNVKGCGAMYDPAFVEGNIRQRPIGDIWRDDRLFSYNRAFEPSVLSGPCGNCEVADVCKGGCRASNYFTTGRLYENYFCPRGRASHVSR